jgi:hypothetical protein
VISALLFIRQIPVTIERKLDNLGNENRGQAELIRDGALEQLDELTRRYTVHPRYYGFVYPAEQAAMEQRVIVRIRARRITCDAIHA